VQCLGACHVTGPNSAGPNFSNMTKHIVNQH
jgi:hypothetical protein